MGRPTKEFQAFDLVDALLATFDRGYDDRLQLARAEVARLSRQSERPESGAAAREIGVNGLDSVHLAAPSRSTPAPPRSKHLFWLAVSEPDRTQQRCASCGLRIDDQIHAAAPALGAAEGRESQVASNRICVAHRLLGCRACWRFGATAEDVSDHRDAFAALGGIRDALMDRNIDGVNVWQHWIDDDGTLYKLADAILDAQPVAAAAPRDAKKRRSR